MSLLLSQQLPAVFWLLVVVILVEFAVIGYMNFKIIKKRKRCKNVAANKDKSAAPVSDEQTNVASEQTNVAEEQSVADETNETIAAAEATAEQAIEESPVIENKPKRVWEVDFLRGLMILFVVWDHFMFDIRYGGGGAYNTGFFRWLYDLAGDYYRGALRGVTHDVFVALFVLTSGVSCSFSRSNGRRAIKMCVFAVLFSVVTYVASLVIHSNITIYFNVIHVIALSVLIYVAIDWVRGKCKKNWQKNLFGVLYFAVTMAVLVVGHCANYMNTNWLDLIFGKSEWRTAILTKFKSGGDYLSFLPYFGWFLVGAFLGKVIYRKKESVFPSVNPKYVAPVTFCGRHSIWIYFASQVVMYGFVYLFHVMLNLI